MVMEVVVVKKKVMVFSGSPRKEGNSDLLCDEFIRGALEKGNEVEKIRVTDQKIHYCIACDSCKKKSGQCIWLDDMGWILEKMIAADVIVLATPVYFYSLNAQLKTLIDRTVARYTEIKNKEFYLIVTAADEERANTERTLEVMRGFVDCLDGSEEKGVIYGVGAWKKGEIRKNPAMKEAYEMGRLV